VTALLEALRAFAEEPEPQITEVPSVARRITTPRFVIGGSPSPIHTVTSCIRTTEGDLDATIAEAHAKLREAGIKGNVWQVGPSCRPAGLADLLRARGFVPATHGPYEPVMTAMALGEPPPQTANPGIEVRLVRNLDEYVQALRVAMKAFNEPEEVAASWMAAAPALWDSQDGDDRFTHLALLDGKPVGFGFAACGGPGILLAGSGVLPAARGRGVYRAILAARWAEAARLGKAGLVIHAGAMSRPILERCGFQVVGQLELLHDVAFTG
jgi:GNAT superfamily N-acetyltransferase